MRHNPNRRAVRGIAHSYLQIRRKFVHLITSAGAAVLSPRKFLQAFQTAARTEHPVAKKFSIYVSAKAIVIPIVRNLSRDVRLLFRVDTVGSIPILKPRNRI